MKKINVLSGICIASIALVACPGLEPRECTEEARSSVNVILEEQSTSAQGDVLLEYSVDGGDFMPCEDGPEQGQPFDPGMSYVCGYEVEGDFIIRATRGDQVVTEEVTVISDTCHVQSKVITITLP